MSVQAFRSVGYDVYEAHNADVALDILKQEKPFDLLFTDIIMPGTMNGVGLAKKALLLNSCMKILFATGYADRARSDMDACLIDEEYEVFLKPYDIDIILDWVASELSLP
ncbi:MAG: response regulator [Bdellovibrionales bacterium]